MQHVKWVLSDTPFVSRAYDCVGEDFQRSRTVFPLEIAKRTEDLMDLVEHQVDLSEWVLVKDEQLLKSVYLRQIYDSFDRKLDDTGERVLSYEGIENGLNRSLYIKCEAGKWYLVRVEDLST